MKTTVPLAASVALSVSFSVCARDISPLFRPAADERPYGAAPSARVLEDGGTGPYKAVMTEVSGFAEHTVFRPADLSPFNPDKPLPVLVWGNGACANSPIEHAKFLNEIASHGYLVLATGVFPETDEPYRGPMSRPEQQIESIDWAFAAQDGAAGDEYCGRIDVKNICLAGMSCGGLQALHNCADPRVTAVMICNSGLFIDPSKAMRGVLMPRKEKLRELHSPVIYILGGEPDIAYGNGMDDFHRIDHVPAIAANLPVGHGGTYGQPHGGEFAVMARTWLDWQLKGDAAAAKMFVGENCGLAKRPGWTIERNARAALAVASSVGARGESAAELTANGVEVNGNVETKCERRVFDDGCAVRYTLPDGARRISRELTEWRLPEDAVAWFQGDLNGFADYELPYESCKVGDLPVGRILSLPVTAKLPDGTYRMMTEANVVDYTDLALKYAGGGRFVAYYHADRDGFDQTGENTTPWRVMLVAKDIQTLYGSDIVRRLCPEAPAERAKAVSKRFAKPGRCIWHWLPAGAPKFDEQKDWYNRTKALGFEYYLIDEGWRGWGDDVTRWEMLKECIDYGNAIGVKSFIWVHSNELMNPQARRAYLAKTVAAGAVGIKIDFMPPPSCRIMKWYEETLADTFDAGLIVDFHGAVKPTGRERFWPHELAREAIRGHEYHITRYNRVLPFEHDTILPFCRLVQGHGDYTPMVFEKSQLIHFTWAHQLAQGIVYACPFLCFGDFPKNYQTNPAVDLIRALPSVYDETRVLPGSEIGECVALARRKGDEWFVAVENGAKPRTLEIALDFIKAEMSFVSYGDAADRLDAYEIIDGDVAPGGKLKAEMRQGGGFVARLVPKARSSAGFAPSWDSLVRRPVPKWYENARFGIFCHWGMQCAAEDGDWYARNLYDAKHWQGRHHRERYGDPKEFGAKDLIPLWKGENWNPDELCALYRKMGATFILAMANHHDNFDNWNSKYQPWNSVNMGPKRDVLGEWSAAAKKSGLRFGASFHAAHAWTWYEVARDYDGRLTKEDGKGKWWEGYDPQQFYCQNHTPSPDYKNLGLIHWRWEWGEGASRPSDEFMENFRLRTMDAIEKYRPDLIYFDDSVLPFYYAGDVGLRIAADYFNMNPDGIVTGKCLGERQRMAITWDVERGTPPEPMHPKWQTDTCIGSWHYERGVYERGGYKTAAQVLRILVDVVSKNGNLCLSIPIRSDGTIDDKERKVCEDIAAWMAVNREAVFDADPYEICGEGPQIKAAPSLSAQGFNEGRIPAPSKDDVRYMKSRNGRSVYAIELAPDGKPPRCPALEANGLKLAKSLKPLPGMPAVHVFE